MLLLSFCWSSSPSFSQELFVETPDISQSGEDYLKAIRLRRIDHDVKYSDPSAPLPTLEGNVPLQTEKPESVETGLNADQGWTVTRSVFLLIVTLIIAFIIFLFVKYGGNITISSQHRSESIYDRRKKSLIEGDSEYENILPLSQILNLDDRRKAIIHLSRLALKTAAGLNNVLLQPSWTARDALRHVTKGQNYATALSSIVFVSEEVQFGERDVSEPEFEALKADLDPLLKQVAN